MIHFWLVRKTIELRKWAVWLIALWPYATPKLIVTKGHFTFMAGFELEKLDLSVELFYGHAY